MIDELEALVKKQMKNLQRKESKALVQFVDEQGTFVCGYSEKPKQINFYFQPLYDQPSSFSKLDKKIKPYLKGKSCLHLPKGEASTLELVK